MILLITWAYRNSEHNWSLKKVCIGKNITIKYQSGGTILGAIYNRTFIHTARNWLNITWTPWTGKVRAAVDQSCAIRMNILLKNAHNVYGTTFSDTQNAVTSALMHVIQKDYTCILKDCNEAFFFFNSPGPVFCRSYGMVTLKRTSAHVYPTAVDSKSSGSYCHLILPNSYNSNAKVNQQVTPRQYHFNYVYRQSTIMFCSQWTLKHLWGMTKWSGVVHNLKLCIMTKKKGTNITSSNMNKNLMGD